MGWRGSYTRTTPTVACAYSQPVRRSMARLEAPQDAPGAPSGLVTLNGIVRRTAPSAAENWETVLAARSADQARPTASTARPLRPEALALHSRRGVPSGVRDCRLNLKSLYGMPCSTDPLVT